MHVNYRYLLRKCHEMVSTPDARILDYGCGAGEVVEEGRRQGLSVWGVEVFHAGGDRRAQVEAKGLLGDEVRELADGRIPFPAAHFDLIVSNQVFEHVPDLDLALGEIARVLQPGGRLLTLFPSRDVFREGHCGVPLAHRFATGSAARYRWLLWNRWLGLGSRKEGKPARDWARDFATYLDRFTFYRSRRELDALFGRYFTSWRHIEEDYMGFRLSARRAGPLVGLAAAAPLRRPIRWSYRKLGGLVIVAEKGGAAASAADG